MYIDLTAKEIELVLTSLTYSKRCVSESEKSSHGVRNAKLAEIDEVLVKLRAAK